MNHPQTLAGKLYNHFPSENLKNIKDYGCCIFVLLWCLGIEPDDIEAIMLVDDLISEKAIDPDCTVQWAKAIKALTGREMNSIEFVEIKHLVGINERTPVRYNYDGKAHWVGVEKGKVMFNPIEYSRCVEKGKPTTKRVIKISGVN